MPGRNLDRVQALGDNADMEPSAIITVVYALAAVFALVASFEWLRFVSRRSAQSKAGKPADLRGISEAATATALALSCAGAAFLFSLL